MTRFTNSENQTGAGEANVFMVAMIHLDFGVSGDLYLHDGIGTITWNSVDWLGAGSFGTVSAISETQDDRPQALQLTLSGIDSNVMTEAMAANYYGRSCKVYVGFLDGDGAFLASPELEFEGRMDSMQVSTSEGTSSVQLTCESRLILWSMTNGSLYTDEDHQRTFSGDLFFDQQCTQADQYLEWGVLNIGSGEGTRGGPGDAPIRLR